MSVLVEVEIPIHCIYLGFYQYIDCPFPFRETASPKFLNESTVLIRFLTQNDETKKKELHLEARYIRIIYCNNRTHNFNPLHTSYFRLLKLKKKKRNEKIYGLLFNSNFC